MEGYEDFRYEFPEQEATFGLSEIIIKTEEVDLDDGELLSFDQQLGAEGSQDFMGNIDIEPLLETHPEDNLPINFDAWDVNAWGDDKENETPDAIPEIESSSEEEVASLVGRTEGLKEVGRIQSDDVEMAIVVDEQFPEDKLLQCISCPFLIPVPKGPPDVFFEKALAILQMRKHFEENHENKMQQLDSSSQPQPTWMDVRKRRRKPNVFSPPPAGEEGTPRRRLGRPSGSKTKNKVENNLNGKGKENANPEGDSSFKTKAEKQSAENVEIEAVFQSQPQSTSEEVGHILEICCLNGEGLGLADRIKMRGRRK